MSRSQKSSASGCHRVPVEDPVWKDRPRIFALQVDDDSMAGRHILAGDVLIFEHGKEPRSGEIVAAFVDGESVVRSYILQNGTPYLKAADPGQPHLIPAHELVIQGTLIRLTRDFR